MKPVLSGKQFGWKIAVRVGVFLALTLGFPFIVYGLILVTNARSVGGASGALALVAGLYLKPVIIGVFVLSLISPCWRRMRGLGLSPGWGLLIPFLFLLDATFLMIVGSHWSVAFSLGVITRPAAPAYAITAVVLLLVMALASAPEDDDGARGSRFGMVAVAAGAVAIIVVILALTGFALNWRAMSALMAKPQDKALFMTLSYAAYWPAVLKPYLCFVLCVLAGWLALLSHRRKSGESTPDVLPLEPAPSGQQSPGIIFGQR